MALAKESPSTSTVLTPEVRARIQAGIVLDLRSAIGWCEGFYLSTPFAADEPLTRERYAAFERWLEGAIDDPATVLAVGENSVDVAERIKTIVAAYEALQDLMLGKPLSSDWIEIYNKPPLRPGETRVYVDYQGLPSYEELKQEFGEAYVAAIFRPEYEWQRVLTNKEISGEKIFFTKKFDRMVSGVAVIGEMEQLGYRPATHVELYAFYKEFLKPTLSGWGSFHLTALGSFTKISDGPLRGDWAAKIQRTLAVEGDDRVRLGGRQVAREYPSVVTFLFVRDEMFLDKG